MIHPKITEYLSLLKSFNELFNITSSKSYDHLGFHIEDSATLASIISNHEASVLDMGSGSGLPSIIIAILNPANSVYAVESNQKKASFLHTLKQELELPNFEAINEDLNVYARSISFTPSFITAKAFAPYPKVVTYAKQFSQKGTHLLVPISEKQHLSLEKEKDPKIQFKQEKTFRYLSYLF